MHPAPGKIPREIAKIAYSSQAEKKLEQTTNPGRLTDNFTYT